MNLDVNSTTAPLYSSFLAQPRHPVPAGTLRAQPAGSSLILRIARNLLPISDHPKRTHSPDLDEQSRAKRITQPQPGQCSGLWELLFPSSQSSSAGGVVAETPLADEDTEMMSPEELLSAEGYKEMSEVLMGRDGVPWCQVKALHIPILMEQMCTIILLLQQKGKHLHALGPIYDNSLQLANESAGHAEPGLSPFDIIGTKEIIRLLGKIIFLIDHDFDQLESLLSSGISFYSSYEIENRFDKVLAEQMLGMQTVIQKHESIRHQNAKKTRAEMIPLELAKALVTSTGWINSGIIRTLKNQMLTREDLNLPFGKYLAKTLRLLESSPALRSKIHCIKGPDQPSSKAGDLIRIALGQPPGTCIVDRQAKIVALSGLLAYLRQGDVGSCFATSLAIQILENDPEKYLDDVAEMLKTGSLKRNVDGKPKVFPFLFKISHDSLNTPIVLDLYGRIVRKDLKDFYIWDSPGVQAALTAVGIADVQLFILRAIDRLRYSLIGPLPLKMTIQRLLTEVITYAFQHRFELGTNLEGMLEAALFAYEAQTQNPLQRVWENALAGMAEATASTLLKKSQIESVLDPIHDFLIKNSSCSAAVRTSIKQAVQQTLNARISILFDPNIEHNKLSEDNQSRRGAFITYDNWSSNDPLHWKRIDCRVDYNRFIYTVIGQAYKEHKDRISGMDNISLWRIFRQIQLFTQTDGFLKQCLRAYSIDNLKIEDLIQKIPRLDHTPWRDNGGNLFQEVARVYLEKPHAARSSSFKVSDAQTLCCKLLEEIHKIPPHELAKIRRNPRHLTPANINGLHAFSFLLGHPDLIRFIESDEEINGLIQNSLINPGLEVSQITASDLTRWSLVSYAADFIVPEKGKETFRQACSRIPPSLSNREFRQAVLDILKGASDDSYPKPDEMALKLDVHLAEKALPDEQKRLLVSSAVHFADTNWSHHYIHESHFCFVVNPGTGLLEVWKAQEDNAVLTPLDQNKWVNNQTWEMYQSWT